MTSTWWKEWFKSIHIFNSLNLVRWFSEWVWALFIKCWYHIQFLSTLAGISIFLARQIIFIYFDRTDQFWTSILALCLLISIKFHRSISFRSIIFLGGSECLLFENFVFKYFGSGCWLLNLLWGQYTFSWWGWCYYTFIGYGASGFLELQ